MLRYGRPHAVSTYVLSKLASARVPVDGTCLTTSVAFCGPQPRLLTASIFVALLVASGYLACVPRVVAADSLPVESIWSESSRKPTPLEDDAALHDVQFMGSKLGWAVGDHGVVWHTRDSGETWALQDSGVTCPLRSVCFLTDRVGWIAGGGTMPFTQLTYGVLLHTTDGGKNWRFLVSPLKQRPFSRDSQKSERRTSNVEHRTSNDGPAAIRNSPSVTPADSGLERGGVREGEIGGGSARPPLPPLAKGVSAREGGAQLPRLTRVKFFSTDAGLVVGQGSDREPSGVFVTNDGGVSWRALLGLASPGWRAADFLNPEQGALAGPRGRVALVGSQQVTAPRVPTLGLRGLYDLALAPDRTGWLVGDGGLLLRTETAGLVWQVPAESLPEAARETFDFRGVAVRDKQVWATGEPGSVVWHSPDGGATWEKQRTGQGLPLAAIHFSSDLHGAAVGALGTIVQTSDGGRTWHAKRGDNRRMALMILQGRNRQVSLAPIVEQSGELGYRSLISVVAGDEPATAAAPTHDFAARLEEAVPLAHGSAACVGWQLPLAIPELDRDAERLVTEWNRRTEGKLDEVLTGNLVRQLRTWRPSVVVLEQPDERDALTRLINDAAMRAINQAADATSFLAHHELAALEPWQVSKVYLRLPPGSSGHYSVDPYRYLPHLGQSVRMAAGTAEGLLFEQTAVDSQRLAYRLLRTQWSDEHGATAAGGFFAGLGITSGSDARRMLGPIDDKELELRQKLARRQRDFASYAQTHLHDPRHAGQLIAQMNGLIEGFPASQGALQLAELAERYQAVGQWEFAELTLKELAQKYPDEPAALKAMQQLVQLWASGEVNWRRMRPQASEQRKTTTDPSQVATAIVQAEARIQKQARDAERTIFDEDEREVAPTSAETVRAPLPSQAAVYRKDFDRKTRFWQSQALQMAELLERKSPALAGTPEVQFPLAALYRGRGMFGRADEIYRNMLQQAPSTMWAGFAQTEFLLARPVAPPEGRHVNCYAVVQRPLLDGVLSDDCWQNAEEVRLTEREASDDEAARPLVMLCRDAEYVYVAGTFPRSPDVRTDGPARERRYDADLRDFDRLTLYLDVDRDRVTWYQFSIDQRGCTSEGCWHDLSWNPRWIVAAHADDTHWRIEAAIPLDELGPRVPGRGDAWGVAIVRTIPGVGWQSWTGNFAGTPCPEAFGLMRFE